MNGSLDFEKYQTSAINRIKLSYATFLQTNSVPEQYLNDFKKDLAEDAYRMIIRKNLRKNKNTPLKKKLFFTASEALSLFQKEHIIECSLLSFSKQLMIWLCIKRYYKLARLLNFI